MKVRTVSKIPVKGRRIAPEAVRCWDSIPTQRPQLDEWVAARLLAGMHPKAIVVATGGTMTLRTAYRWKRALLGLEVVEVGGMRATFALRRGQAPARITAWEAAA